MTTVQLYITVLCVLIIFEFIHKTLWLKHVKEINKINTIVVDSTVFFYHHHDADICQCSSGVLDFKHLQYMTSNQVSGTCTLWTGQ